MAQLTAHAPDITCEGCANAIQRALGKLSGVSKVEVDVPSKDVTVQYEEGVVTPADVLGKLSRAGYDSALKTA